MKSVFVTGATGGIGRALVPRLEQAGWRVFAALREPGTAGSRGEPIELDLTVPESVERARDAVAAAVGGDGLQGLVNNAGISVDGPVELLSAEALRQQFEVNVFGQVAVTQAFLPLLREGRGRIVFMGGAAGRLPLPMRGALSASKAALDAFSTALRMELKYQGVAVTYIEPGALRTEFFERAARDARRQGFAGSDEAQRRYRKAAEIANEKLAASRMRPPEVAAGAVVRALTARRPAARHIIGTEIAWGLRLLPHLPTAIRDRIIMSSLGLGPSAFAPEST